MFSSAVLEPEGVPPTIAMWQKRSDFYRGSYAKKNTAITTNEEVKMRDFSRDFSPTSLRDASKSPDKFNPELKGIDAVADKPLRIRGTSLDLPEKEVFVLPMLSDSLQLKSSLINSGIQGRGDNFSTSTTTAISRDEPVTTSDLSDLLPEVQVGEIAVKRAPRIARPSQPPRRRDIVNGRSTV